MEKSVKQLFIDYILNRCNQQETERVLELIRRGGQEQEWLEAMKDAESTFAAQDFPDLQINDAQMLAAIKTKTGMGKGRKIIPLFPWKLLAYASAIVLVLGTGLLLVKNIRSKEQAELALKSVKPVIKGQTTSHKWVKLSDGSSVHLNHDSYLEYPDSFEGKKSREVSLVGEGYFDVKHDPKRPFIIHTGKIKTTVLGTAFNINAYRSAVAVMVTVTHGKVRVEDDQRILAVLTPNQQLEWTKSLANPVKMKVNAGAITEWKNSDLIMDDITLKEAASLISERFGVKVHFKDQQVKTIRFTAAFLKRNDLSQVLEVIGQITGANLTLENQTVTIDGVQ